MLYNVPEFIDSEKVYFTFIFLEIKDFYVPLSIEFLDYFSDYFPSKTASLLPQAL